MTGLAYLGSLLVALGGLAVIDRQHRLAFWCDARRAAVCVGVGVVFFLLWDVAGLALGIFARGASPYMTGVLLAPELPLEEVFFLALLSYNALLAWRGFERLAERSAGRRRGVRDGGGRPRDGGGRPRDGGGRPRDGGRRGRPAGAPEVPR